jgi:hypothetical protein
LGLGVHPRDRQRQAAGLTVRCPKHGGVSCSVTRGQDGTVRVRCFGCGFSGDALTLIAEVHGLDPGRNFREVLRTAAELARRWDLVEAPVASASRRQAGPPRTYPPSEQVSAFWGMCAPCSDDAEVASVLERRGLSASAIDDLGLARALPLDATLPPWARFRGQRERTAPWTETGHRLVLPVYDARGCMRSVRAWCVRETEDPKRLPPAGHRSAGLVLACAAGVALLHTGNAPERRSLRIVIAEGEPDFLTWATHFSDACIDVPVVLGVVAGAWSEELAARIPLGARVIVRTHHDVAGNRYAESICRTLSSRCAVLRAGAS